MGKSADPRLPRAARMQGPHRSNGRGVRAAAVCAVVALCAGCIASNGGPPQLGAVGVDAQAQLQAGAGSKQPMAPKKPSPRAPSPGFSRLRAFYLSMRERTTWEAVQPKFDAVFTPEVLVTTAYGDLDLDSWRGMVQGLISKGVLVTRFTPRRETEEVYEYSVTVTGSTVDLIATKSADGDGKVTRIVERKPDRPGARKAAAAPAAASGGGGVASAKDAAKFKRRAQPPREPAKFSEAVCGADGVCQHEETVAFGRTLAAPVQSQDTGFEPLPFRPDANLTILVDHVFRGCSDAMPKEEFVKVESAGPQSGVDMSVAAAPANNYGSTYVICSHLEPADDAHPGSPLTAFETVSRAYGGWPGDANTAIPIRSLSKTYFAVAVLAVIEDPRFDITLDTRVDRFLDCGTLGNATFASLMGMASLDNRNRRAWLAANPSKHVEVDGETVELDHVGWPFQCDVEHRSPRECVEEVVCPMYTEDFTEEPHVNRYGGYEYDNYGYTIAEVVLERATGRSAMEWVVEKVLRPLGMQRTIECSAGQPGAEPVPGCKGAPTRALLYGHEWPDWHGGPLSPAWISNAFITSPRDMARFLSMLLGNGTVNGVRVISSASVNAMMSKHNPLPAFRIGDMGLGIIKKADTNFWGWGGSYGSRMVMIRDRNAMCAVFCNIATVMYGERVLSQRAYYFWWTMGKVLRQVYGGHFTDSARRSLEGPAANKQRANTTIAQRGQRQAAAAAEQAARRQAATLKGTEEAAAKDRARSQRSAEEGADAGAPPIPAQRATKASAAAGDGAP